jgi:chromosome partitioning protein
MAARIITVAQQKGGAGKTTLVAHLAVAWAGAGKRVAAVDIDPQQSLTSWYKLRTELLGEEAALGGRLVVRTITGWRAAAEIERLARDHDVVVVDSPPHAETEAKIAVRAAHLVVLPIQPSPMDLWATRATLDLAKAEGTPAILVLNRVPPRARLTEAMTRGMTDLGATIADAQLGNRVALAATMLEGKGVTEAQPRSTAAGEIAALVAELLKASR